MRASAAAAQAGVSVKALRYYESVGLICPARLPNGYRSYSELEVGLARQIAALTALGLSVEGTRPFIACLRLGHVEGDTCVESLVAYRAEIRRLDSLITELTVKRGHLQAKLNAAARRGFPEPSPHRWRNDMIPETYGLPENLPVPTDDGRAAHLVGQVLPDLTLAASDGSRVRLGSVSAGRWVLFVYPMTGVPGQDLPQGWDDIPGARGCTPEACGFRDNLGALRDAGAGALYGLSAQGSAYQAELTQRLHLPYLLLSDPRFELGTALNLPTFQAGGAPFYQRLTLILRALTVEHAFYPIFPPNEHAAQVLEWLQAHPSD